uniref:Uncharacterized protein n=1 Tax=Arundo donax TaxID=35708 RepID=A0A0A9C2J5_ARUDO
MHGVLLGSNLYFFSYLVSSVYSLTDCTGG